VKTGSKPLTIARERLEPSECFLEVEEAHNHAGIIFGKACSQRREGERKGESVCVCVCVRGGKGGGGCGPLQPLEPSRSFVEV
jgi:hypothetical protein